MLRSLPEPSSLSSLEEHKQVCGLEEILGANSQNKRECLVFGLFCFDLKEELIVKLEDAIGPELRPAH